VTVVEYEYRLIAKQEAQSGGVSVANFIASPYVLKYEPQASVLLRVQSSTIAREYFGSATGPTFLPSERPTRTREELLDDAVRSAARQLALDLSACGQ